MKFEDADFVKFNLKTLSEGLAERPKNRSCEKDGKSEK